eukprot:2745361-Prymnesium_polylepis.1
MRAVCQQEGAQPPSRYNVENAVSRRTRRAGVRVLTGHEDEGRERGTRARRAMCVCYGFTGTADENRARVRGRADDATVPRAV